MHPNFAIWACLATLVVAQKVLVPKPDGPFNVEIRTTELIDKSRTEIFDPAHGPRKLMTSLFIPTNRNTPDCQSEYMPKSTAAYYSNFFLTSYNVSVDFSRYTMQACSIDVSQGFPSHLETSMDSALTHGTYPLTFFSPGYGNSRLQYNAIAQFISSQGFLVLTIDHPYTSGYVQFADGTVAEYDANRPEDPSSLTPLLPPTVLDAKFLLDQLSKNNTLHSLLFPYYAQPTSLDHVGYLGHSFGGATAAQTVYEDKRFAGGIDYDGALYGSVVDHGESSPFVLFASDRGDDVRVNSPGWDTFWNHSSGFKRTLELTDASHGTFSDDVLLGKIYPWNSTAVGFGPLDGLRATQIIAAYAGDFLKYALQGGRTGLLSGPNKNYPEVVFIP